MTLEDRLSQDLKAAMLAGQSQRVMTLRGLKSSVLYAKVAKKVARDQALPDEEVLEILAREAKKRQESTDLYLRGGNQEKAKDEQIEKAIIEEYLPEQLSQDELTTIIDETITELGATNPSQMGQVIAGVKAKTGMAAEGSEIARLVRERLSASK